MNVSQTTQQRHFSRQNIKSKNVEDFENLLSNLNDKITTIEEMKVDGDSNLVRSQPYIYQHTKDIVIIRGVEKQQLGFNQVITFNDGLRGIIISMLENQVVALMIDPISMDMSSDLLGKNITISKEQGENISIGFGGKVQSPYHTKSSAELS